MAGLRIAVVLFLCCLALGQAFVLPILLKKIDLGYWPVFGYRSYQQQQQQQLQQFQQQQLQQQQFQQPEYPQREIIQVFPQYPPPDLYKTGQ